MKKFTENKTFNGVTFTLGYKSDAEYSGEIFMIHRNGKKYGAIMATKAGDEFGFMENQIATEEEMVASQLAKQYMRDTHGILIYGVK